MLDCSTLILANHPDSPKEKNITSITLVRFGGKIRTL